MFHFGYNLSQSKSVISQSKSDNLANTSSVCKSLGFSPAYLQAASSAGVVADIIYGSTDTLNTGSTDTVNGVNNDSLSAGVQNIAFTEDDHLSSIDSNESSTKSNDNDRTTPPSLIVVYEEQLARSKFCLPSTRSSSPYSTSAFYLGVNSSRSRERNLSSSSSSSLLLPTKATTIMSTNDNNNSSKPSTPTAASPEKVSETVVTELEATTSVASSPTNNNLVKMSQVQVTSPIHGMNGRAGMTWRHWVTVYDTG